MNLTLEVTGDVAHIRFNRPRLHNMVNRATLEDLAHHLADLDTRVVVLSGTGPSFCAGADLRELRTASDDELAGVLRAGRRAYQALLHSDAVTIAVVHGKAFGAGVALAVGCDLRIAQTGATFALPELAHGISVSWAGSLPRLLDEIGPGPLRRTALLAETLSAERAAEIGLVHEVCDDPWPLADEWIARCAGHPARAVAMAKRQLRSYSPTAGTPGEHDEDLLALSIRRAMSAGGPGAEGTAVTPAPRAAVRREDDTDLHSVPDFAGR